MERNTNSLLYSSRIVKVYFSLCGSETNLTDSYAPIISDEIIVGDKGVNDKSGGVFDRHLGTIDYNYRCLTCYQNKIKCLGHDGHFMLNYPVLSPLGFGDLKRWLKIICFNCGNVIVDDSTIEAIPKGRRLEELAKTNKSSSTSIKRCVHCKTPHPVIKKDNKEYQSVLVEFYEDKKIVESGRLYPHVINDIVNKISDLTVEKLGRPAVSHPRKTVLTVIKVPPTTIRPDVKKIDGVRSTNDDITATLQHIIKISNMLSMPITLDAKTEKRIFEISNLYYNLIKAPGGEDSMKSFSSRLKGKEGRFRLNQMGKRVRNCCRSTITCDPTLRLDEVGVPLIFAQTVQYEEIVQPYNREHLLKYIRNGKHKYPGCSTIIKKKTGIQFHIDSITEADVEIGDMILRDMISGDPVSFNRQPSFVPSNITSFHAVVCEDPSILSLRMNVLICPYFNADFDGDQMNLMINTSIATRNEVYEISSSPNFFISHENSVPALGQKEDSVVGMFELTKNQVVLNKYNAMLLFAKTNYIPSFTKSSYTGREIITLLFTDIPFNYKSGTSYYDNKSYNQYIDYDLSDTKVLIENGEHLTGVLDKSSIGGEVRSIYQAISSKYGKDKALSYMYDMQHLAVGYLFQQGYTIGIMDLMIPQEQREEIFKITTDNLNKANMLTNRLNNGEIIPSVGKTVESFYEKEMIETLKTFDEYDELIVKAINPETNNLFKLIISGSKGKPEMFNNMVSAIGQRVINDERIRQTFGYKRTLPFFPRFDTSPTARGYITNCYIDGLTSVEYNFGAQQARFEIITKALFTSLTGEQNRKSIKSLESIIVNNFRRASKGNNIVQFAYGEDFLSPTKLELATFPTVMMTNDKFEAEFKYSSSNTVFADEFKQLKADRDEYRQIYIKVEKNQPRISFNDKKSVCIDVERVISDVKVKYPQRTAPTEAQLIKMNHLVNEFCQKVTYVTYNTMCYKAKIELPDCDTATSWLLQMLIRSCLCSVRLIKHLINEKILNHIFDTIFVGYKGALIAPGTAVGVIAAQAFSFPLTQYMIDAHHRSAVGGTSKTSAIKAKEVMGAKPVKKLEIPESTLFFKVDQPGTKDANAANEVANSIEVMKFERFITTMQVFYEKYGEPVHSKYKHEAKLIEDFNKMNILLKASGDKVTKDLSRWCIRFLINKISLILRNISIEEIIKKLREIFPEVFIVYTPENAKDIVIRIYLRNSMLKTNDAVEAQTIAMELVNTVIRGTAGIVGVRVDTTHRTAFADDGSIVEKNTINKIFTTGTNLGELMFNPSLDAYNCYSNSIKEIEELLGIEACRQNIIRELRDLVPVCNIRHYMIYADEMTYTGHCTSIERNGLSKRENHNVCLRIGFSSPIQMIEEAAVKGMEDKIAGITAPLIIGSIPRHGTIYNSFVVDETFVKENTKSAEDYISEL